MGQSPSFLEIDTHQYYAFAPLVDLPHATILESVCNISRLLKSTDRGRVPRTIVGEWSLQTGRGPDDPTSNRGQPDQDRRTWFRLLFESQLAAYSPSAEGQASLGWYYWTCERIHVREGRPRTLADDTQRVPLGPIREDGMGDRYLVLPSRGTGRIHPGRRQQRFDPGVSDPGEWLRRFVLQLYRAEAAWNVGRSESDFAGLRSASLCDSVSRCHSRCFHVIIPLE